jgi:hypothetical protein
MTTQQQLKSGSHLSGRHRHTYEAIFRHPTAHNLEWHDVRSLLAAVADLTEAHNGAIKVARNGQIIKLPASAHKDVASVDEVLAIRHFLEKLSETTETSTVAAGAELVVVIDHHEAKIYRTVSREAVPARFEPYDPHGFGRHLRSENPETSGRREPERKSFYEAIAATLRGADAIVIFGAGTGESSATEHLLAELKHHHRDLVPHIIGSFVVDEHHQTEGQLLAQAREAFEHFRATGSSVTGLTDPEGPR